MGSKASKSLEPQLVGATYLWHVEEYSNIPLCQPKFSSDFSVSGDSYRFELMKDGFLQIGLRQNKPSDSLTKFRCVSAFVDHRGILHFAQTKEVEIGKGSDTVLLLSVPQKVIENSTTDIIPVDRISIQFKITDLNNALETSSLDADLGLETLSLDLGKLYSNQTNCDVELRAGKSKYFKAHRLILSARTPVFAAMFHHNTVEQLRGIVNIVDVEVSVLGHILFYIYTGKVRGLNSDTVIQLIKAADKYDLQKLKKSCLDFLLSNLTVDNICDAAVLADMCVIPTLQKEVEIFISNNTAEVIQSDQWKDFQTQHPTVVNSLLSTLLMLKKSDKKQTTK